MILKCASQSLHVFMQHFFLLLLFFIRKAAKIIFLYLVEGIKQLFEIDRIIKLVLLGKKEKKENYIRLKRCWTLNLVALLPSYPTKSVERLSKNFFCGLEMRKWCKVMKIWSEFRRNKKFDGAVIIPMIVFG